jgi:hypothetical protein
VAQARLSVRKIREVLRLKKEARLSDRQVAAVLGSARSTVQECLRRARTAGLSWPLPGLDDDELHERLYPRMRAAGRYPTPDFEAIQRWPRTCKGVRPERLRNTLAKCDASVNTARRPISAAIIRLNREIPPFASRPRPGRS